MFAKLLKHEFRATRNGMGILCLSAIAMGLIGGIAWRINCSDVNATMKGLCAVGMLVCVLGIAICAVGTMVLLLARFYQSHFTDQAYLTFTLPVSTHSQLLAGILNMVLNLLLSGLCVVAAYCLIGLIALTERPGFWRVLGEQLPEFLRQLDSPAVWKAAGWAALACLTALASGLSQLLQVMTAMTLGALIARKHKVLMAVVVYYGAQILFGSFSVWSLVSYANTMTGVMWQGTAQSLLVAVAAYFLTHYLITKKLNLP